MNPGTDASEQVFRMTLEGSEFALKMAGKGLKNLLVAIYTILSSQTRTKGKTRLTSLLKSGKQLKLFSVPQEDMKEFVKAAKKYGVLYAAIRTPDSLQDGTVDIMVKAEDAARINYIIDKFKMASVSEKATIDTEIQPEKETAEKSIELDQTESVLSELLDGKEKPEVEVLSEDELIAELFGDEPEQSAEILQVEPQLEDLLEMDTDKTAIDVDVADPLKQEIADRDLTDVDVPDPLKQEIMANDFEYTIEAERKVPEEPSVLQTELTLSNEVDAEFNRRKNDSDLSLAAQSMSQAQERRESENPTLQGKETSPSEPTSNVPKQSGTSLTDKSVRDTISDIKKERNKAAKAEPVKAPEIKLPKDKGR